MYEDEDYEEKPTLEVGYRRPPKAHQFQKGRSGNPKGRPKKRSAPAPANALSLPAAKVILGEASRLVQIREGDSVQDIDTLQAMIRALNVGALKGNRRAQVDAIKLVRQAEETAEKEWAETVAAFYDLQKVARDVLADHAAARLPPPKIYPHPDDVVLDLDNRRVIYNGPSDDAEAAKWERMAQRRKGVAEEIEDILEFCRSEDGSPDAFASILVIARAELKVIDGIWPDEKTRRRPGFNLHAFRRNNGILEQLKRHGWRSFLPKKDDVDDDI